MNPIKIGLCVLYLAITPFFIFAQSRQYYTQTYMETLAENDPQISANHLALEIATQQYLSVQSEQTVTIPIVFHILYANETEQLSVAQIQFQLDALITRTIQALPDDDLDKGFYHKGGELNTGAGHLAETTGGNRDSESDVYSYSFGGVSGKFVFNNIGNIRLIPENDIKIIPYIHPTTGEFLGFIAKTPDGTTYYLGQHPNEVTFARETIANVTFDNNDMQVVGEESTTSWHLIKIESYDQNHTIDFAYNNNDYQFFSTGFCSDVAYHDGSGQKFSSNETNEPDCQNEFLYQVEGVVLRTITSSTQTVTFNYLLNREDLLPSNTAGGRRAINQIVIENGDDFCIKYNLSQSY